MNDFFEWLADLEKNDPARFQSWIDAQIADGQGQDPESLYNRWLAYKQNPPVPETQPGDGTLDLGQITPSVQSTQPVITSGVPNVATDIRPNRIWNQNELLGNSIKAVTQQPNTSYYNNGIDPQAGQRADNQKQEDFEKQQIAKQEHDMEEQAKKDFEARLAEQSNEESNAASEEEEPPVPEAQPNKRIYNVYGPSNLGMSSKEKDRRYSLDNMYKLSVKPTTNDAQYSLDNMDKLNTKDAKKVAKKLRKESLKYERVKPDKEEEPPTPEATKEEEDKKAAEKNARSARIWGAVADGLVGGTSAAVDSAANALASTLQEGQIGLDPSGQSALMRAQAMQEAQQAAEMDKFKQDQLQKGNRDYKQEAERQAASNAAAQRAQRAAQTAEGYVDQAVVDADYAQKQQMQQQYMQQAGEYSKDADQYRNAATQREMDAAKADYDYNENRRVNNRIFQLTGGYGVKTPDGNWRVFGGNYNGNNEKLANTQQEATPATETTQKTAPATNTQPAPATNTQQAPVTNTQPAPAVNTQVSNPDTQPAKNPSVKTVNNVNFTDERIKQREAARVNNVAQSTSTPKPATSTPAANETTQAKQPIDSNQKLYTDALWNWASVAKKLHEAEQRHDASSVMSLNPTFNNVKQKVEQYSANRGNLQSFNLNDRSVQNVTKVFNYLKDIGAMEAK